MKPTNCTPRTFLRAAHLGFHPLGVVGFVRVCLEDDHLAVDICPYHLHAKTLWPHLQPQDWWTDLWVQDFLQAAIASKFGPTITAQHHILLDDDGKEVTP